MPRFPLSDLATHYDTATDYLHRMRMPGDEARAAIDPIDIPDSPGVQTPWSGTADWSKRKPFPNPATQQSLSHAYTEEELISALFPSGQHCRISSRVGMRMHPIKHKLKMHEGTDISGMKTGTPIRPICDDGTVVKINNDATKDSGLYVVIKHGETYSTYMHLSQINCVVKQRVNNSTVIGLAGTTGGSTGTHLHLELWTGGCRQINGKGTPIDPLK